MLGRRNAINYPGARPRQGEHSSLLQETTWELSWAGPCFSCTAQGQEALTGARPSGNASSRPLCCPAPAFGSHSMSDSIAASSPHPAQGGGRQRQAASAGGCSTVGKILGRSNQARGRGSISRTNWLDFIYCCHSLRKWTREEIPGPRLLRETGSFC